MGQQKDSIEREWKETWNGSLFLEKSKLHPYEAKRLFFCFFFFFLSKLHAYPVVLRVLFLPEWASRKKSQNCIHGSSVFFGSLFPCLFVFSSKLHACPALFWSEWASRETIYRGRRNGNVLLLEKSKLHPCDLSLFFLQIPCMDVQPCL